MSATLTSTRTASSVASISRAIRALEAFANHPGGVALTRLSGELGYGKASLSKILSTLEREGFVRCDAASGHFHLSWRLLALAYGYAERVGMPDLCLPVLQALADETGELVQLAVVEGDDVLFVAKAEGADRRMRMVPLVGAVAPLHATASGKVWLASLPDAEAAAILARQSLPRLASRTMTSRSRVLAQLREIRARGYATVDEELVDGGRAVAAAIVHGERVVGAVAVSGPMVRLPLRKLHRMATSVRRTAAQLGLMWPHGVTAHDFGFGVPLLHRNGRNGRSRARVTQA
ncbi:MAG TPA: IclR family transcriptional regulator [Methylomirabilota bacterium]|nr:IclR family transcriptional regulator [Methylomirabilota bacterium]